MSEKIDTALRWAVGQIEAHSESPRLDAELLLAHCLQKTRSYLYTWPQESLTEPCWQAFQALVEQRMAPTPIAYLLGAREFYSREFLTTPAALVPRPETEVLIDVALERIPLDQAFRLLDLGTGSGIIAITLQLLRPGIEVTATDVDPACLDLARANAQRHGVEIAWIESDWYAALADSGSFDMIVSNPPYIAGQHPFLQQGDLPAEPRHALSPGDSGLEALHRIIDGAPRQLRPGGWILLEHGYDQEAPVATRLHDAGFSQITCATDLNNLPRCTSAKLIEK